MVRFLRNAAARLVRAVCRTHTQCSIGRALGLAIVVGLTLVRPLAAQSARFWISMSNTTSAGPEVPVIQRANGQGQHSIHLGPARPKQDAPEFLLEFVGGSCDQSTGR